MVNLLAVKYLHHMLKNILRTKKATVGIIENQLLCDVTNNPKGCKKTLNDAKFLLFAKINKWLSKTNIEINKNIAICRIKLLHMLQ